MSCNQWGMPVVGTMALDTKAKGNRTINPIPCADSGPLDTMPRQAHPHDRAKLNRRATPNPATTDSRVASARHPMTNPVSPTMIEHSRAANRSDMVRPTSTAARQMGRARKRSMAPVVISVLRPTAVPMAEVVRFKVSRPARAKSL
jgi:hypothetical protein